MEALVMILKNTSTDTYHPIFYLETGLSGGFDSEHSRGLIRYKSERHHIKGFSTKKDAIRKIEVEVEPSLASAGFRVNKELDVDIEWDGISDPDNIQFRSREDSGLVVVGN